MSSGATSTKVAGPFDKGDFCGPYEIAREHGRGGMAIIYEAIDPAGERRAIKVLQPGKSFTRTQQKRFWREIDVLRGIVSNNVVRFYEAGQHGPIVWLAMEFLEGDTLAALIAREAGQIASETALHWAIQIAQALAAIHAHRVVHRDLKPHNVIIDNGIVKVFDFGIAQYEGCFTTTQDSMPPATLAYMSPEQAAAESLDTRTDIFNFGLILYELITGRHALGLDADEHATRGDLFASVMKCEVIPLAQDACDPRLAAIVHKALARDPDERFSSAQELGHALVSVLRGKRDEQWAKTVVAMPGTPPHIKRPPKDGTGSRERRGGHLRLVQDAAPDNQPARVNRYATEPMKPDRLASVAPAPHDTVQLAELYEAPKRLGSSSPPERERVPAVVVQPQRSERARSAVSRTLFMKSQRQSSRERWILIGALVLAVPVAWSLGRQTAPVIVAEPNAVESALPTPVRVETSAPSATPEDGLGTDATPSASITTAVAAPTTTSPPIGMRRAPRTTISTTGKPGRWGQVEPGSSRPTNPTKPATRQSKPASPTSTRSSRTDHGF